MSSRYPEFNIEDDLQATLAFSQYSPGHLFDELRFELEFPHVGEMIAEDVFVVMRDRKPLAPGYFGESESFVPTGPTESPEEMTRRLDAAKAVDRLELRLELFPMLSLCSLISLANTISRQLVKTIESSIQWNSTQGDSATKVHQPTGRWSADSACESLERHRSLLEAAAGKDAYLWHLLGGEDAMQAWRSRHATLGEIGNADHKDVMSKVRGIVKAQGYPPSREWYLWSFTGNCADEYTKVIIRADHNLFVRRLLRLKAEFSPLMHPTTSPEFTAPTIAKNWTQFVDAVVQLVWVVWLGESRVTVDPERAGREVALVRHLSPLGVRPDEFLSLPLSEQSAVLTSIDPHRIQPASLQQLQQREPPVPQESPRREQPEWLKVCEKHGYVIWSAEHDSYVWIETLVKLNALKRKYFLSHSYDFVVQQMPFVRKGVQIKKISVASLRNSGTTIVEPSKTLLRELDQLFGISSQNDKQ